MSCKALKHPVPNVKVECPQDKDFSLGVQASLKPRGRGLTKFEHDNAEEQTVGNGFARLRRVSTRRTRFDSVRVHRVDYPD